MFAQAAALRHPSTPPHKKTTTVQISSPIGPRRYSLEWYKHKLSESMEVISDLTNTSISIEDVDGILPLKKIQPTKSKTIRIMQEHGSMRANDMLNKVRERNEIEKEKEDKKQGGR